MNKLVVDFSERLRKDSDTRMGVVFALDMRPEAVEELSESLRYKAPRMEVVALSTKDLHRGEADFWLRYFRLRGDPPGSVKEALEWFSRRFPEVIVLPSAIGSAEQHRSFERPDLVLKALHVLARVYLDWTETRRAQKQRLNNTDLTELSDPPILAMRTLMAEATFDASDSAEHFYIICPDEIKRDFTWHLKLSLAGPKEDRYHWRAHYARDREDGPTRIYLGHCGIHR